MVGGVSVGGQGWVGLPRLRVVGAVLDDVVLGLRVADQQELHDCTVACPCAPDGLTAR